MIVRIDRWKAGDVQTYGTIRCSPAPNSWGEIDTEVWFCPHCGTIYAREYVQFEENERKLPLLYHVLSRPCYMPLHELTIPHPTMWNCSDETMLNSAIKEYFSDARPESCPALQHVA